MIPDSVFDGKGGGNLVKFRCKSGERGFGRGFLGLINIKLRRYIVDLMNEAVVTLFITSFFRPYEASYIPQALAKIKFKDFQHFQHFRLVRII